MATNDTVQGQLNGILNSNSKLMKTANTFGKQQANQRGLLNSSMAAGASQNAMIQNALPIAQQDAGYQQDLGKMGKQNQYTLGQMDKQNQYTLGQMDKQQDYDLDRLQATSMANAWGEMANNTTDIVAQSLDAINNIQASSNISADDKSTMIDQLLNIRDSDISFQQQLYKSLPNYLRNTNIFPSL